MTRLSEAVKQGKAELAPASATEDELRQMSAKRTEFSVLSVEAVDTEEFGVRWSALVALPGGSKTIIGLWAHPERDLTMSSLMALCQDGPVDGVIVSDRGRGAKPFYVMEPAD